MPVSHIHTQWSWHLFSSDDRNHPLLLCYQNGCHIFFCFLHPTRFIAMVTKPESRAVFIKSAISFLHTNNFDGLNLAWEYPGHNGSPQEDKERFTQLVMVSMACVFLFFHYDFCVFICNLHQWLLSVANPTASILDKHSRSQAVCKQANTLNMVNMVHIST